jgi:hypothetical protein
LCFVCGVKWIEYFETKEEYLSPTHWQTPLCNQGSKLIANELANASNFFFLPRDPSLKFSLSDRMSERQSSLRATGRATAATTATGGLKAAQGQIRALLADKATDKREVAAATKAAHKAADKATREAVASALAGHQPPLRQPPRLPPDDEEAFHKAKNLLAFANALAISLLPLLLPYASFTVKIRAQFLNSQRRSQCEPSGVGAGHYRRAKQRRTMSGKRVLACS